MSDETENNDAGLGLVSLPRTHAESVLRLADAMLRTALWPAAAVVVVAVVVSAVVAGIPGAVSALIGGVVAVASSLATLWLMRRTSEMVPMAMLAAALGGFIGKMLVLLVVMMLLGNVSYLHTESLAFTMLATVVVWAGAEVVAFRRTKIPTLIIGGADQTGGR